MGFIGALWPHDEVKYSHILMAAKASGDEQLFVKMKINHI